MHFVCLLCMQVPNCLRKSCLWPYTKVADPCSICSIWQHRAVLTAMSSPILYKAHRASQRHPAQGRCSGFKELSEHGYVARPYVDMHVLLADAGLLLCRGCGLQFCCWGSSHSPHFSSASQQSASHIWLERFCLFWPCCVPKHLPQHEGPQPVPQDVGHYLFHCRRHRRSYR